MCGGWLVFLLVDRILSIFLLSILLQAVANNISSVSISVCYRQPTQQIFSSLLTLRLVSGWLETQWKNKYPVSKAIAGNGGDPWLVTFRSLNSKCIVPSRSFYRPSASHPLSFAVCRIYILLLRTCVNILLANKFICPKYLPWKVIIYSVIPVCATTTTQKVQKTVERANSNGINDLLNLWMAA